MYLIFSALLPLLILSSETLLAEECSSGEKLPDEKNCQFYWECFNGRLIRQSCGQWHVFSKSLKSCVALNSRNDDCTKRDTTLARSTESEDTTLARSTESEDTTLARSTESEEVTTSACSVGAAYRSQEDCRIYFECQHDKYVQKRCIGSKVYSNKSRKCVNPRSEYNDCQIPSICTYNEIKRDPKDCRVYYVCIDGKLVDKQCLGNQVYSLGVKRCVYPNSIYNDCTSYVETTTPHCTVGEMLPKPDNSCAYFLCDYRYQLQEKQCPRGQVFSPSRKQCVTKYGAKDECSPRTTIPTCTPGELRSKPYNCSSYYLCDYNYKIIEKQCASGGVFSPSKLRCVLKLSEYDDCSLGNKTTGNCTPGELLPKPDNCSNFYLCDYRYNLVEKECRSGQVFSPSRKLCVLRLSAYDDCNPVTKPSPCTPGELLPKKDNCSSYFMCDYNYELQEKQCETGKVFSTARKQCVQKFSVQDDCSRVTKPSPCTPGEFLSKKDNCSSYFLCGYNYELQEKQCETGKVFSPTRKQCVQKFSLQDDCSQVTKPFSCTLGEFLPKKDNCSSYFLCGYNYELQEKQCETGKVFSPTRKQCVQKFSLLDDCSQVTKPSPCSRGEFLPKKENCSSYFVCDYNYEQQEKQCETGKVFSPTRKQCVQKFSLQDDCSQVTKPSPCTPGEFLPKKDNCSSYSLCDYNYELQQKQCQTGKVFSPTRKQCVQKFGLQDDCSQVTKPSPCTPGELLPKKDNCSSYFLCDYNYKLQEKQCQTGKVFSTTRKQCVQKFSVQDDCSQVSATPLCEPGMKYRDLENCSVYYLCRFGVRVRRICPSGQHYSVALDSCVVAYGTYDDCTIS